MKRHLLTQTMLTTQTSVRKQTAIDVHSCHEYLDISPKQLKYEADFSVLFMHASLCTRGFIRGLTHFQKLKRASHQQYTHTHARTHTHTHKHRIQLFVVWVSRFQFRGVACTPEVRHWASVHLVARQTMTSHPVREFVFVKVLWNHADAFL